MDRDIDERWKSSQPPLDGDCLHLNGLVQLPHLRELMRGIVELLRDSGAAMPLYRFDDWHEHDGYITQRSTTDWYALDKILADENTLYAARHGDTHVRWAYYPADFSFLFRFYVLDTDEDFIYPGIWGDCDLCASSDLIRNAMQLAPESITQNLAITKAEAYFGDRYAG